MLFVLLLVTGNGKSDRFFKEKDKVSNKRHQRHFGICWKCLFFFLYLHFFPSESWTFCLKRLRLFCSFRNKQWSRLWCSPLRHELLKRGCVDAQIWLQSSATCCQQELLPSTSLPSFTQTLLYPSRDLWLLQKEPSNLNSSLRHISQCRHRNYALVPPARGSCFPFVLLL